MKGTELRRIRQRLGMSQTELAREIGVAPDTVSRWERGALGMRESAERLIRRIAAEREGKR